MKIVPTVNRMNKVYLAHQASLLAVGLQSAIKLDRQKKKKADEAALK